MRRLVKLILLVLMLLVVAMISALTAMRFAIHRSEVEVPNLTGKTSAEAEELLHTDCVCSVYGQTCPLLELDSINHILDF